MSACRMDLLEAHLRGDVHGEALETLVTHLGACAACHQELAWLRVEHRAFADRARDLTPPYVQLAPLRQQVDARIAARAQHHRRARAAKSGGALLSAVAAVLIAVFVSVPAPSSQQALSWMAPETCSSLEPGAAASGLEAICTAPSTPHELVAAVENQFDACLVATPRWLPSTGLCE